MIETWKNILGKMVKKDLSENLDGREPVLADHREVSQQERITYAKDLGKNQPNKQTDQCRGNIINEQESGGRCGGRVRKGLDYPESWRSH